MPIFPIPTSRGSDILFQSRLTSQLQADQLALLRIQTQISTGRRIQLPSEDAPAATQAITLQRLLEQKDQIKVNISTGQSYLDATDSAIANLSTLLNEARGSALTAIDGSASNEQRLAAAEEIKQTINTLIGQGNVQFRGRYLFAGSQSNATPFNRDGLNVLYGGNTDPINGFSDIDSLFQANISGDALFGALSPPVGGQVDLNPIVTAETKLTDLRGGQGIRKGSIAVSDGTTTSTIDISGAETIGDVARLIETNPPAGRTVRVRVEPQGLVLSLADGTSGNLTVREVGSGTTAAELGIYNTLGVGTGPLVGQDLDPILRPTNLLADLLGVRARAHVDSAGANNDIAIEAVHRGSQDNGVAIQYVDDGLLHASPGLVVGAETATYSAVAIPPSASLALTGFGNNLILTGNTTGTSLNGVKINLADAGAIGNTATASYNATTKTLTLGVDSTGATEVQELMNAINAEGTFSAAHDPSFAPDGAFNPTSTVNPADVGNVVGNTGASGGNANTIFVYVDPGATTANDVVNAINNNPTIAARFKAKIDGHDTSSPGMEGRGYVEVPMSATTSQGSGTDLDQTSGLKITNGDKSGVVDISGAKTVEDLLNLLNGAKLDLLATVDPNGKGIQIQSRASGADLSIGENGGLTASQLGIRTLDNNTLLSDFNYGQGVTANPSGNDFTITRSDGVSFAVTLGSAQTVQDVLNLINNDAANVGTGKVFAQLASVGNGITLTEFSPTSPGALTIARNRQSEAARQLGLVGRTVDSTAAATGGPIQMISGRDANPIEVKGVFNSLLRLQRAIEANDPAAIERASGLLQDAADQAVFGRADIGARSKALDAISTHLDDEQVQLKAALSGEIDTDLVSAISDLQARQASFQATLQLAAKTYQLSLLNFL
jgi:flagellar hook-associated protein 3 FlgL